MSNGNEQIFQPVCASNLLDIEMLTGPVNGAPTINTINLENVSDFTKVCRVCATVTELVMPIFSGEGLRINLADKIKRHLPIKVTENDVLPLVVCYQCSSTLLATHELVACSLQADAALRTAREQRDRRRMLPDSEDNAGDQPGGFRRCEYCPLVVLGSLYKRHLIRRHAQLVFHCAECDSYVARTHFLVHMTRHAHQYEVELLRCRPVPPRPDPSPRAAPLPRPPDTATPDRCAADHGSGDDETPPAPEQVHLAPEPAGPSGSQPVPVEPNPVENIVPDQLNNEPTERNDVSVLAEATDESEPKSTEPKSKTRTVRQCPHCPKTYTANSSYFYHLKYTHGKSREHECSTCSRRFGTRGALREHATLHDPNSGLQCEQCGKSFRSKAGHYIHAQTHKDEKAKKFACAECGVRFRWRAELKRHTSRHAGRRSHVCACGRGFAVRADLLRHARTHARAAHSCPHAPCAATFAQERYLRAHVTRKHQAAPAPAEPRKSA